MVHEVLTLQFGQQANYIGTHYWNTQESYFTYAGEEESPVDHDVSFRPGIGADGSDTYTPRTVVYDLKGSFGTLQRENALYELHDQSHSASQGQWSGSTIPLHLSPIPPSPYQQALDAGSEPPALTTDTVRFWSDYNHVFYHPRSIVQLNDYELNSSLMPFEQFQKGEELFANLDREHDLLDRDLRRFLEECDQLQAIQVFSSTDEAWGGFASKYLERIADELGKGSRWVFGLQDTQRAPRERQSLLQANVAQTLYSLASSASLHIPTGNVPNQVPAYASVDCSSRWLTSALQAAAIESITLPTRLRGTSLARTTFDHLESALTGDGKRRIAACSFSVRDEAGLNEQPLTNGHLDSRVTNGFSEHDEEGPIQIEQLDMNLFPELAVTSATSRRRRDDHRPQLFGTVFSTRGTWQMTTTDGENRANGVPGGPRTASHHTALLFPVLTSFPRVFHFPGRPQTLAIRASLTTSSSIADQIRSVEGIARRMVSIDEREALCDGLASIADEYEEGWRGESDSENEDY